MCTLVLMLSFDRIFKPDFPDVSVFDRHHGAEVTLDDILDQCTRFT